MKTHIILIALSILLLSGCINKPKDLYDPEAVENQLIESGDAYFDGKVDPNQDWNPITTGSVTIKADAELADIVKVQVLTESPFLNEDARVLNEAEVSKGGSATLKFDAPNTYTRLIAACVDSKGFYYIKGFNIGETSVSFAKPSTGSRMMTRAGGDLPSAASLKLSSPKESFNALRTVKANEAAASGDATQQTYVKKYSINLWEGAGWENERLWCVTDGATDGEWTVNWNTIFRTIDPISDDERALLKDIYNTYLFKTASYGKRNNLEVIRNNSLFQLDKNYLTCDGVSPVTVIPVQMNSTESNLNSLYYYYFNPYDVAGMSDEQQAAYLKSLPKYLAVNCYRERKAFDEKSKNLAEFNKVHEYLLPYYGDGIPSDGQAAVSAVIPAGYKVGFMVRKAKDSNANGSGYLTNNMNGCTYGDGRLNKEINMFPGHFRSAQASDNFNKNYTMQPDDPRNVIFGVNGNTYVAFEDGADCNYCDMIIQVANGTNQVDEPQEIEAAAYTMCFEDRLESADYDMNDVVLQATRISETRIQISIIACGAADKIILHGLTNCRFDGQEVHEIFGLEDEKDYINTHTKGLKLQPMSDVVKIDKGLSMRDYLKNVYIENQTTRKLIKMPEKGRPPYAIIVPQSFQYPLEGQNILYAYKEFINWAGNVNASGDWYKYGEADLLFPDIFNRW